MPVEFRLLGPVEVVEGGRQIELRRPKQRALLALLLLRPNEAVASDELVDALWGESPPDTAQSALHCHVSALRKLLGAQRIETRTHGYALRAEPHEIDLVRFEGLVAGALPTRNPAK